MVNAGTPDFSLITRAAKPVGASIPTRSRRSVTASIRCPSRKVLPVPAYPRSRNTDSSGAVRKARKEVRAACWFSVSELYKILQARAIVSE